MGTSLGEQALSLGHAVIAGVIMGIYYDIFRIIRRIFRNGYVTVMSQDIFFFVTSAFFVFFSCVLTGSGELRVNFVLTVLASAFVYCMTVGGLAVRLVSRLLLGLKKLLTAVYRNTFGKLLRSAVVFCRKTEKNSKKTEINP